MKNLSNKNKITVILIALLLLAGIITLCVTGFEKATTYKAGTKIEVYIPTGYEKQDILAIAKESFSTKEIGFEEVEKLNQVAGIKLTSYTEEELDNFKTKICEKYNIKEKKLEIYEIPTPKVRVSTEVMPYVFPIVLVTVISSIYVLFRNLKSEDKWKKILRMILTIALVLGVYFSIILVLRIPFGFYTMPVALAVYIITLMISVKNTKK